MPYAALLSKTIKDNQLQIKDIANKCKVYGVDITASYISMIKKEGSNKIPSDEVSRALAKACGVEEELFVLEAYIDKAPSEFIQYLNGIRASIINSFLMMFTNSYSKEDLKVIEKKLYDLPLAEFIIESNKYNSLIDFKKTAGTFNLIMTDENTKYLMELKEPIGYPIQDDSMFPIINKGSMVTLDNMEYNQYKDGDILCYKKNNSEEPITFRKCFFFEERTKANFVPFNQSYQSETLAIKDITILGKANKVITNL